VRRATSGAADAVAESFFATQVQAEQVIFEYIEAYYNRARSHSSNGLLSPAEFERLYHQSLEGLGVYQFV
jgi:transposase InsO family protein